jgi:uncharacterized membrane protein YedE/YeeE
MKTTRSETTKLSQGDNGDVQSLDRESQPILKAHSPLHYIRYILAGIFFGILLVKGEVISWFRIQEMISVLLLKKFHVKALNGESMVFPVKKFSKGNIYGGLLFGFGWAMTGACPGPLYAQIGTGAVVVIFTLLSAIAGTWVYGLLQKKLPH